MERFKVLLISLKRFKYSLKTYFSELTFLVIITRVIMDHKVFTYKIKNFFVKP